MRRLEEQKVVAREIELVVSGSLITCPWEQVAWSKEHGYLGGRSRNVKLGCWMVPLNRY